MNDVFSDMELAAQRDSKADELERLRRELAEARGLLAFAVSNLECGLVSHEKHEYHTGGDCPVMARLRAAISD